MRRRPAACGPAALATLALALVGAGCGAAGAADVADPSALALRSQAATTITVVAPRRRGPSLLVGTMRLLDGTRRDLAAYRGRVVMVVNTASRCGNTPQYEALEALWRARRAQGLMILGFPSNDFNQEPGGNGAVARFCRLNYGVSFPMSRKVHVRGARATALFAALAARPAPAGGEPEWNFTKYLLDRRGRLAARVPDAVSPDDPGVVAAMERLLAEPAPGS